MKMIKSTNNSNNFPIRSQSLIQKKNEVSEQFMNVRLNASNPALAYINSLASTDTTGGQANARYTLERFSRFILGSSSNLIDWPYLISHPEITKKAVVSFLVTRAKNKAKMKGLHFDSKYSLKNLHITPLKEALFSVSQYLLQNHKATVVTVRNFEECLSSMSTLNETNSEFDVGWLTPLNNQNWDLTLSTRANAMLEAFSCFCIRSCIERMDWQSVLYAPLLQSFMQSFLSSRHSIQDQHKKKDYAPATADNLLRMLRGVAHHAWLSESISVESLERIKAIKLPRGTRQSSGRYLSYKDVDTISVLILDQANKIKAIRDNAIFWLMYESGLRRAEVVSLDLSDLDMHNCNIRVIGKGNKERYVPFSNQSDLYSAMQAWLTIKNSNRNSKNPTLFCCINRYQQLTDKRLTTQTLNDLCKQLTKLGFHRIVSPHDFRHSVATNLLRSGHDLLLISKFMGHSSITTTQRYDRRSDDELKGIVPGR